MTVSDKIFTPELKYVTNFLEPECSEGGALQLQKFSGVLHALEQRREPFLWEQKYTNKEIKE